MHASGNPFADLVPEPPADIEFEPPRKRIVFEYDFSVYLRVTPDMLRLLTLTIVLFAILAVVMNPLWLIGLSWLLAPPLIVLVTVNSYAFAAEPEGVLSQRLMVAGILYWIIVKLLELHFTTSGDSRGIWFAVVNLACVPAIILISIHHTARGLETGQRGLVQRIPNSRIYDMFDFLIGKGFRPGLDERSGRLTYERTVSAVTEVFVFRLSRGEKWSVGTYLVLDGKRMATKHWSEVEKSTDLMGLVALADCERVHRKPESPRPLNIPVRVYRS